MHVLHINSQVVNARDEAGQIGDLVRVDYLASLERFSSDTH